MKHTRHRSLAVLAFAGVALISAAPAEASMGVSIDTGSIEVSDQLAPGGEYRLPSFGIRNPGSEPTTYRLVVTYVADDEASRPPETWFSFAPADLTLGAGETRPVQTQLAIPPGAEPGEYTALVGPEIVSGAAGAKVGAAAAARITFTVAAATGLDGWLRFLWRVLLQNLWIAALGALLVVLVGLRFVRGRVTVSVARRP